ncbi:SAM-dependent methyltransferase [Spiribacter vilamensis]|uniref:Cyclopropane-fatty-acyl-phospholipid synthase n=1 Tax=Spiribacter vilamensis TaxID=531306 RepID=A0A4Q8D1G9_9GAMM|nr:cyclopropane-fatty-acyl-phospholipid synthase family protein [Spiribacter vilamensis]RZU99178.1 cyclopropane-fatty-acyl-phospholipid synthase [Spiribacter vilamensis]TVO61833.1 class I SAM-dependent methyltransferase [Spiribacter vilamensis]
MTSHQESVIDLPSPLPLAGRILLGWFSRLRRGRMEGQMPDGEDFLIQGGEAGPTGILRLHRPMRMMMRIATRGSVGFAESYMAGEWSSPDIAHLLELMQRNEDAFQQRMEPSWLHRLRLSLHHRGRRNTQQGSRRNIAAHYDLGNEFYRHWLDETMTYSAAIFERPDQPLAEAQRNKYDQLLDTLGAQPGEHILEIGCGWGGFAMAAARRGIKVTGLTLSTEQLAWARRQIAEAGFADQVDLRLEDYRDTRGRYDHAVSIEMLEAVGEDYWPAYFRMLHDRVRPGGRIGLHGITIEEDRFEDYRRRPDFIQRYIFPGGMLPTPERLEQESTGGGLEVLESTGLGQHYATTLLQWDARFVQALSRIRELGFDDYFINMWRYYLAYCYAGFRTESIDVKRVLLRRP